MLDRTGHETRRAIISPHPRRLLVAVMALVVLPLFGGCDKEPTIVLFDPDREFRPDPILHAVEPPATLAGIGHLTINGENFSPQPAENLVYFDETRSTVVDASPSQLIVATPNLPKANVIVRVSVVGAEKLSNSVEISLEPAVVPLGNIQGFEEVFGMASDENGDMYISLFASNVSAGIKRISPDGERSDYAASTFKWDALGMDEEGFLYGVRNVRAVFRFPPGGGNAETWAVADDAAARFRALDVDRDGNVWVGGGGGTIYRVDRNGEFTASPAASVVNALNAFEGYLYVGEGGSPGRVVRHEIEASGTLGTPQEVFSAPPGGQILSLAVTADGELLVGTTTSDPIYVVNQDGSSEVLYPDLLEPTAAEMAWGIGPMLYVVRSGMSIYRLNTQREGPN